MSMTHHGPFSITIQKPGYETYYDIFNPGIDDIKTEMDRIASLGIRLLNDTPKIGADNMLICFLHPKDTFGVLIELCQEINQ